MSTDKGPTKGGSGGKRGHSNMEHWTYTEELKQSSKVRRRNNEKKQIREEVENLKKNKTSNSQ